MRARLGLLFGMVRWGGVGQQVEARRGEPKCRKQGAVVHPQILRSWAHCLARYHPALLVFPPPLLPLPSPTDDHRGPPQGDGETAAAGCSVARLCTGQGRWSFERAAPATSVSVQLWRAWSRPSGRSTRVHNAAASDSSPASCSKRMHSCVPFRTGRASSSCSAPLRYA